MGLGLTPQKLITTNPKASSIEKHHILNNLKCLYKYVDKLPMFSPVVAMLSKRNFEGVKGNTYPLGKRGSLSTLRRFPQTTPKCDADNTYTHEVP